MKLLALDIATTTGIASGGVGESPRLFHFTVPSKEGGELIPLGRFLLTFSRYFRHVLEQEKPDAVFVEAPVLLTVAGGKDNMAKVRKLASMGGIVAMICTNASVPCYEVQPSEVKKLLAGHARAKKPHMVTAARVMGFDPKVDDEADALGVFLCGVKELSPHLLSHYTGLQANQKWRDNFTAIQDSAKRKMTSKREKTDPAPLFK